jgi:Protein of unknown function DUF262
MTQSFTHSADTLQEFFAQPGRGFYVPYYQRGYSWDEDNAAKLVTDLFRAIRRTTSKKDNSIFLGTVILHNETNIIVGTHTDTPNLLTKVSNVVDGQQRITSLGILACVLVERINIHCQALNALGSSAPDVAHMVNQLTDEIPQLNEFFSVTIKRAGAQPNEKPLIIRAGDVLAYPQSDQWTLNGNIAQYYRSSTAVFFAQFINKVPIDQISKDDRINSVVDAFAAAIVDQVANLDQTFAADLVRANGETGGSLFNFLAYPPNLAQVTTLSPAEQSGIYTGILLMSASFYLRQACHFVVIECSDLALAFDMFQSLNATGTPLTAFEVFKPTVVRLWGTTYATSIKWQIDRIEQVIDASSDAGEKEDVTDKIITSAALSYNGKELSRRFSEERDWLESSLGMQADAAATALIRALGDQAEYNDAFVKPTRPKRNTPSPQFVADLVDLGLPIHDAQLAALCIYYLRDAKHYFAHSVLSLFYAKLVHANGAPIKAAAIDEFLQVCKATSAFFTLWMGALQGRFPDPVYRQLFQGTPNMSEISGTVNRTAVFLKQKFREALDREGIYAADNSANARAAWVNQAQNVQWYGRQAVCKFALFVASQDAAPDMTPGNEGLYTNGMPGSATFLTPAKWYSVDCEVIEHVATRKQPAVIKFPAYQDTSIYPGNFSVVDKIGNLTLLSNQVNASIYSEWPEKVFYYWSLTMPAQATNGPAAAALQTSLGLAQLPPSLSTLVAASNYLPHLAPLAARGMQGFKWDGAFIQRRSLNLCERVFTMLDSWLR